MAKTTIQVDGATLARLKAIPTVHMQSYDTLINKLIDLYEKVGRKL